MDSRNFRDELLAEEAGKLKLPFFYRKLRKLELHWYDVTMESLSGGEKALDIGCGYGGLLLSLREKYCEVWGVDIDESCITRIREILNEGSGIHVEKADANKRLDFEDSYFDAVVVLGLLPLFFDPTALFRECHRLLCPSGTLVVQVPNLGFLPNRARVMLGHLPATLAPWEKDDFVREGACLHYFTRSSTKQLLQQEDFEVRRITCSGIFAKLRRWWAALLCGDIIIVATKK